MTSKQMPHQVGECPSGAPRNVPPASTPKSTPPQCSGGVRTSPSDPLKKAAKYKSAGWRKDLQHVLKIYYKHNAASFKEVEWTKMKEKFFTHLLQCNEEWMDIKEKCPMEYMPYMEDHFYVATSLRLNALRDFTGWIKPGSYYHGLVARQGHLHRCPHLVGAMLPRWPQVMLSESHLVSQKKVETPATPRRKWIPQQLAPVCPVQELGRLKGPTLMMYLLPWRQVERVMAGHGQTRSRPV